MANYTRFTTVIQNAQHEHAILAAIDSDAPFTLLLGRRRWRTYGRIE